jgi:5'-nucleotidase
MAAATSPDGPFVFGVDLDGVCADYHTGLREFVAAKRGIDPATMPVLDDYNDFSPWGIGSREEFAELHAEAVTTGLFERLDAIEGASRVLWRLSDEDVWVRIITHRLLQRPKGFHAVSVASTVTWLDGDHLDGPIVVDGVERPTLIPYRDICFIGDKPEVGAAAYVDDAPYNIESLRAAGGTAIVFDQPYNQQVPGLRAHNWDEVYELLCTLRAQTPAAA